MTTEETPQAAASDAIDTGPAGTLPYECPHCHRPVKIRDDLLGQTVNCPECDRPFRVPAPEAVPIDSSDGTVPAAAATPVGRHAAARDTSSAKTVDEPFDDEHVDRVIHPVVLRRHFFRAILCGIAVIGGLAGLAMGLAGAAILPIEGTALLVVSGLLVLTGLFFLGKWYIASKVESLTLTDERLIYERGLIHRKTSELRHKDIRNIKIDRNLMERLLGFGDMALSSSGQNEMEIVIHDIPNPEEVADFIRRRQ